MAYRLITRANLAKMVGKSRQYITTAVNAGLIGMVGSGRAAKVNLDDGITIQFLQMCKENRDAKEGKITLDTPGMVPPIALNDTDLSNINIDNVVEEAKNIGLETLSKPILDRLKAIEEIRTKKQKRLKDRKDLVRRDDVRMVFSKLFMIHVNQLRTLDRNIVPDIAAVYGSDDSAMNAKVSTIVNNEVFKTLDQIKITFNKWLEDFEVAPMTDEELDSMEVDDGKT